MFIYRYFFAITIILILFLSMGCDDDKVYTPTESFDGSTLLGLVNGRSLTYLQTDTTITAEPFSIEVTTSNRIIGISGQGDDWVISDGSTPLVNLKVTQSSVIQNGFWRNVNSTDSLFYFAAPPVILKRGADFAESWSYFTPMYENGSSSIYFMFYYSYFGFSTTKEYVGIQEVITPSGAYNAYRFDVQLYAGVFDTEPSVTVTEYYAPDVGLIQLHLNSGPLKRSLNLISYTN